VVLPMSSKSWFTRLAVPVLVTALLAGCGGSRLSTQEIADALTPPASASGTTPTTGSTADHALPAGTEQNPAASTVVDESAFTGAARTRTQSVPRNTGKSTAAPAGIAAPIPAGKTATAPAVTTRPVSAGPRSTLVFGNIASYSGLFGAVEGPIKYSLSAWVAMQNARGGLDGHPIKLIIGDDRADPVTGLTIAKRMVENYHILAFAGNTNGFGFDQYADYADSKGVPFIGGAALTERWYTDPGAFPATAPTSGNVVSGVQHFIKQGATRLGLLYCVEVAKLCSYLNESAMKSSVGKYIVADEQVSLVAPSYTSQCLRLQAAKVEAVYALMDTAAVARMTQNCATQGYRPKYMILGLDATVEFPKYDALQGTYLPGATVPLTENQIPAVAEYHAAMAKYAPGVSDGGAAGLGWADGLVLGRAGVHLPDNPTADDLKANLWKMKSDDLGGFTTPLTFPKGKPAVPTICMFIWGVKDHKFYAPEGPKAIC
jgi:branched-chain amino acid transport system substrate-binding protein